MVDTEQVDIGYGEFRLRYKLADARSHQKRKCLFSIHRNPKEN